jgi:uncharacterized glyoxalase superfamily protein PhnB
MASPKKRPAPKKKPAKKPHGGRRKGSGRPRGKRFLEDFAQVGPPPTDPLRATEWGMQLLTVSLDKVRTDSEMTERERRSEMKSLLRHMKDLIPAARLSIAERKILEFEARKDMPPAPTGGSGGELRDAEADDPSPLAADYRELRDRGGSVSRPAARGSDEPKEPDAG